MIVPVFISNILYFIYNDRNIYNVQELTSTCVSYPDESLRWNERGY